MSPQRVQTAKNETAYPIFQRNRHLRCYARGCAQQMGLVKETDEGDKAVAGRVFQPLHLFGLETHPLQGPVGAVEPGDGLAAIVQTQTAGVVRVGTEGRPDVVGDESVGLDAFGVFIEQVGGG